jgi:hypothetical protein
MSRVGAAIIAILCICCGGGDSADSAAPSENRPPQIESIAILPAAPTTADSLSLASRVQDPDLDSVVLDVQWYQNGALYHNASRQSTKPFSFKKGDRIYAIAVANDGRETVSRRSPEVVIENSPPQVTSLRLSPETALAIDPIRVIVQATDVDGDPTEYRYRWYLDGERLATEGSELPAEIAKRENRVSVEVAAFDGTDQGPWISSAALRIGNSAPSITTQPAYALNSDGVYEYAVNAVDPDGDRPLTYELLQSPPGMRVGSASGIVTWAVPRDANGAFSIELSVSDPYGARTLQRYSLDLSWGTSPAATP